MDFFRSPLPRLPSRKIKISSWNVTSFVFRGDTSTQMVVVFFHCHVSFLGNNIFHYASMGLVYYVYLHFYPQNYPKCIGKYTIHAWYGFVKSRPLDCSIIVSYGCFRE